MLKFKFSQKVRDSIANNILKASWMGAVIISAVGYNLQAYWAVVAVFLWWVILQTVGNYILGLVDDNDNMDSS